jgi:hypothetical protein
MRKKIAEGLDILFCNPRLKIAGVNPYGKKKGSSQALRRPYFGCPEILGHDGGRGTVLWTNVYKRDLQSLRYGMMVDDHVIVEGSK